jgi:hypothetical protein
VNETFASTDLGAFQAFDDASFLSAGNPTTVLFDEFRFGTAESDVVAPEPASLSLLALGGLGLLARRRKRTAGR